MKLKFYFCCALALFSVFALTAQGQRVKPQNVLEYFTALPTKYLGEMENVEDRRKIIAIKDLENGYLKLSWNELEGWGEVALFKNADGTKTLGVQIVGCGPGCQTDSIYFVQYNNGEWIDVTKDVLPEISDAELRRVLKCVKPTAEDFVSTYYELPRYGTTVKLIDDNEDDENGSLLYELAWNGSRFVPQAKRDRACKAQ